MKKNIMAFREVYQMFLDIWSLYRKYACSNLRDNECSEAAKEAEQLSEKYNSEFGNEILTAVMCELSRIAKKRS